MTFRNLHFAWFGSDYSFGLMALVDLTFLLAWLLPGLLGCPTPIGGHHPHLLVATATAKVMIR